jgi:sulfur-carrier protein
MLYKLRRKSMHVKFYATLRDVVGEKSVEFKLNDNPSVYQLIEEMIRCYPMLRQKMLDENGNLDSHIHIFINGRDVTYLENGFDTKLSPEDSVTIFPAVGGGSLNREI